MAELHPDRRHRRHLGGTAHVRAVVAAAGGDQAADATDPSHHFGGTWEIGIQVATNGQDADTPTGPVIPVGDPVAWTHTVTNTGNQPLADVTVTDDQPGVTPTYTGGDTNGDGILGLDETWSYEATGTAAAGQYGNVGTATADQAPAATDPGHYLGADDTISGVVWHDLDGDGVRDPGEPGLAGIGVQVGNVTVATAGDGSYLVDGLQPGTYAIAFIAPDGYRFSPPGQDSTPAADGTASASTPAEVDAGLWTPATVTGQVIYDANASGTAEPGEPGLGGVTVHLIDATGATTATTSTAHPDRPGDPAAGTYRFEGLAPGTYTAMVVTADLPAGMVQTVDPDALLDAGSAVAPPRGAAPSCRSASPARPSSATRCGPT